MTSTGEDAPTVFRPGDVTYLRIPAPRPWDSSEFYRQVFGWKIGEGGADPSFSDATGHVIGHFMHDLLVVGEAGVLPYVYVDSVDVALRSVAVHGGEVAHQPYPEGDLWVATFRDPAGNVIGVWQRGPRLIQ